MIYRRVGWLFLMLAFVALPGAASGLGGDDLAEARAAMQRQAWDTATRLLNEVVEREPDNLEARYLRGICYAERGKHRTVESLLRDFLGKGEADFTFVLEYRLLYIGANRKLR